MSDRGTRAAPEGRGVLDLRLVPAALAVWAVTALGLVWGWMPAALVAAVATGAVPVVWGTSTKRSNGLLVVLILAAVAGTGVALSVHQVESHPLRTAATHGARTVVRVELADRPTPLHGASFGASKAEDRALAKATLQAVREHGQWIRAGGDVLLLVPTAQWRDLIAGQEVTVTGKAVVPQNGELAVAMLQVSQPPKSVSAAPAWQRGAEVLRDGLRRTSASVLSPIAAALLPGLVVGDTTALPPEVVRDFHTSGLAHLMAVSGANVAIVCGAVLLLLRLCGAGPVVSAVGAGLALAGFVILAGPAPSVLRAAVMGAIALLALVLGRDRSALPALSASVMVLVLLSPGLAMSAGFVLSVIATAALVLLAPGWAESLRARGVPPGVAEALAVSAAAHVVTAPVVAALSGEVSVVALAANLLAEPVVAPATVLGVLATITAPVSPWLAEAFTWLSAPELEWLAAVAHHAAAFPGAAFSWPAGSFGGLLLAALTLLSLIVLRNKKIRWTVAALVLVVGLCFLPVRVLAPGWPAQGWSVVACDVGQGDGLVLSTGEPHTAVVVDTGPDPTLYADCLKRLRIDRIPLALLTHLHADHVSGLRAVLADRTVGAVAIGGLREPAWAMADIARDTRARGVRVMPLSAGQQMRWPGLVLEVLGPVGSLARTTSADDANDASLVVRATTSAGRILLTGDIELAGQSQLMSAGADLRADVLKTPHHGSRYTTPRFLAAVRPRLALISVGNGNRYGHPSPLVVSALTRAGAKVLRTDQEGDIAVVPGNQGPVTISRGGPVRARSP